MRKKRPVWLRWPQIKRRPAVVARLAFNRMFPFILTSWNWINSIGENGWRNATIVLLFIAVAAYVCAALYIFQEPVVFKTGTGEAVFGPDVRARAVTPLLLGLAGFVTLVATLWRGTISARQTEEQKRQNDSKDDAELALLLEKAHKLLNETPERVSESEPNRTVKNRSLALALLETIVNAESEKYAVFALELTIDQIVPIYEASGREFTRHIAQVERIFELAAARKRTLNRHTFLNFDPKGTGNIGATNVLPFAVFSSLPPVIIAGANVRFNDNAIAAYNKGRDWRFRRCTISGNMFEPFIIRYDDRIGSSEIYHTRVLELGKDASYPNEAKDLKFVNCFFSDAVIKRTEVFDLYRFENCKYLENHPPVFADNIEGDVLDLIKYKNIDIRMIPKHTIKQSN
jgi:hypothetical protein